MKKASKKVVCNWKYDDDYDFWKTSCGKEFVLNDGTPKENGMVYCYHCGKPIKITIERIRDDRK